MKTIPWIYKEDKFLRLWVWKTEHFEVQIRSDSVRFFYLITDLTSGRRADLDSDQVTTFEEAENAVKEVIGKSYPPHLGYRDFAGPLATTFRIYSGDKIDFSGYEGANIHITVAQRNSDDKVYNGTIQVSHHNIILRTSDGVKLSIPPQFIKHIEREYGEPARIKTPVLKGRTVNGEATRGCTGKMGFLPNTVVHSPKDDWCPIHNI